jgi:hypothetical protein
LTENDVEDVTPGIHSSADGASGAGGRQSVGNKSPSTPDDQYSEFVRRNDSTLESLTLDYSASRTTKIDEIELEDVEDKSSDELKLNGNEDAAVNDSVAVEDSGLEEFFVTEKDKMTENLELRDAK